MGDTVPIRSAKSASEEKPKRATRGRPFGPDNPSPTQFKPGQSGNPNGRPKVDRDLRDSARKHSEDALAALASIVNDGEAPASARVQAAIALLDRGHGKPIQTSVTEVSASSDAMHVTVAELMAMADQATT